MLRRSSLRVAAGFMAWLDTRETAVIEVTGLLSAHLVNFRLRERTR